MPNAEEAEFPLVHKRGNDGTLTVSDHQTVFIPLLLVTPTLVMNINLTQRWRITSPLVCVLSLALCLYAGCIAKRQQAAEKTATIYCATDREFAVPILDAFERANGDCEVTRVFDVESSKTLGLVTRIEQERTQPKCDLFWNNEILHTIRLQKAGLLEPRRWQIPDGWPTAFIASDQTWVGFAARARVLVINTQKLPDPSNRPTRVQELADEKWKGKCGFANPVYGTTATHFAVLASHPNSLQGIDWKTWETDVRGSAVMLAGNKQVALAVASGELEWGLTDTDDAIIEKEKGMPVEIVFPDQITGPTGDEPFGTLFIPNTVAVVRGGPHPVLASKLADYLISEKTESRLTMSSSAHFPIWPGAAMPSRIEIAKVRKASVDFERAAKQWEAWNQTPEAK